MTTSDVLTIVFGFGIITLATVALLNVAGHRLHELQILDRRGRDFAFVYTYSSKAAADLRVWFSRLPLWLGVAAVAGVSLTCGLFVWATLASEDGLQPSLVDVITWGATGTYVIALVGVTTWLSARLYGAMGTST